MDRLIRDSIKAIKPLTEKTEDLIYDWIQRAIIYLPYIREGRERYLPKSFKEAYKFVENKINNIETREDIIFYRGVNNVPEDVIELDTITSITHKKRIAEEFGKYVIKILIPKGSNAFFISAIDYIKNRDNVEEDSEFETLILPGRLIKRNNIYEYLQC